MARTDTIDFRFQISDFRIQISEFVRPSASTRRPRSRDIWDTDSREWTAGSVRALANFSPAMSVGVLVPVESIRLVFALIRDKKFTEPSESSRIT
jgi:hypothetical protein